ncbi:hypothetical protein [Helicobacter hepaticus]|jgi:hypothetical protein|uniref:Uncharacterized protein n=1 Tax=Helicobacter hepaticus (strain ATCC 51449 / 3B1) TaxID=235279 RepID=Q7VJP3_HELHP|nr:hypothetical protein [Helicobacter hepaticus]AAP76797.1 hypothetical protein HH_0200 [Helicobacter hepaticus ATCC 51449]
MAIGRVIHESGTLFPDFDMFEINYELFETDWEMKFFLNIPHLTKVDILEYFECYVAAFGTEEVYSAFFADSPYKLNETLLANDPQPNYISEYIHIVGQLFLAGYIEFGMCGLQDKEENLLSNQKEDKYQAWIYFRDNFFYKNAYNRDMVEVREKYPNMSDDEYVYSTYDTPQYWDMYRFWVAQTEKGTKYFNEILAPRFYNKYKDLSVEIDSKGNIIRWIGKINR